MDIFERMTNRSFAATLAAWAGAKGRSLRNMFWQLVANGIVRCYETNDVSHVNKLVAMATNTGQLRRFERLAVSLIPFAYDKGERKFAGKRQDGKFNAMADTWEQLLFDAIQGENDSNAKAKSPYDFDKALAAFMKTAAKNEYNNDRVVAAVVDQYSAGMRLSAAA